MDVFETRKHIKSIKTGDLARLYHTNLIISNVSLGSVFSDYAIFDSLSLPAADIITIFRYAIYRVGQKSKLLYCDRYFKG